jgi:transposase
MDGQVKWRDDKDTPPAQLMISSPYDTEARYSVKRDTTWTGYKAHLTESCDADLPHLITHVETTIATVQEVEVLDPIHRDLEVQDLLPDIHLVDPAYTSAEQFADSQRR